MSPHALCRAPRGTICLHFTARVCVGECSFEIIYLSFLCELI